MNNPEISFVKNKNIDRVKWDKCIENSPFSIAYGYSWFLDRICSNWDALICGDYQYIMPLVTNTKLGIPYLYHPFFSQQLGIFSASETGSEIVNQFLNSIPGNFKLADIRLNLGNLPTTSSFRIVPNTTYHLDLHPDVDQIRKQYHTNTRRNIQKAVQNKISISTITDVNLFLEFTQKNLADKSPEVKTPHYSAHGEVMRYALSHQHGEIYGAWDSNNTLLAATFFVNVNQKSIYLAASSTPKGTEQCAMFLLIDTFIGNKTKKNLLLDFEGSNIPGVARFYAGFGAVPQTYFSVHQNRLPKLLRIFKK